MTSIVSTAKTCHEIGQDIKGISERVKEVAERCDRSGNTSNFAFEFHPKFPLISHFILFLFSLNRYKVDAITPVKTSSDPRITTLYSKALVGIDEPREE
jgi:disease resistance protein RPM1